MTDQAWWFLARASGLIAFYLAAASTLFGLAISGRTMRGRVTAKSLTDTHEALSIATILVSVVHVVALVADSYIEFSVAEMLVPGRTPWRTTASALGIVAFWLAVLVTGSFYVRRLIGLKAWRVFHYTSFAIVVLGLVHGLLTGADTKNRVVQASYIACGLAVIVLTVVRMSPRRRAEQANRTAARVATIRVKVTGKSESPPEDGLPAPDPFVLPARMR